MQRDFNMLLLCDRDLWPNDLKSQVICETRCLQVIIPLFKAERKNGQRGAMRNKPPNGNQWVSIKYYWQNRLYRI